jgi:hypothetical protein
VHLGPGEALIRKDNKMRKQFNDIVQGSLIQVSKQFDIEEVTTLGDIHFTHKGEENLYFEYKDKLDHICKGFFKY